ncbi:carbohydrate-binding module family 13 protein [Cylindrobasidium torrendii FP15055 ss-10]|uniref:Carbohydrate-binding module family 13 protein n=1 Tax=Cylindrobasidium torrendii FP15055 ss-10 TaxID=1314674 RepID=A0A0D7BGH2_9AGAR|nr:carbohydrate-binding module family 13 protein [Cylindrobasidium torrendii FP15055 ss-10]
MSQITPAASGDSYATASDDMQEEYGTVYRIEAASNGMCADLSGQDHRSLIGFATHDGDNQRWEIVKLGAGHAIRSVYNGVYLSLRMKDDSKELVGSKYPISWDICSIDAKAGGAFRIRWPESEYLFTMDDGPNAKIRLAKQKSPASPTQVWRLRECAARNGGWEEVTEGDALEGARAEDMGHGKMLLDVDKIDFSKGKLVVSTTTTTRIHKISGL